MKDLLHRINSPEDLKKLGRDELPRLADELRQYIIDIVAHKGGHLGAGLGTIELTIALHYCYNTPYDILIWDVGHQAYGHKILTGRRDRFPENRKKGGLSGFPKRDESEYDAFGVGHSSTSLSALLGMAVSADLSGVRRKHIAVIGDAAMQAGMTFEALNHLGSTNLDILIVLNDNSMSIDPSVGALNQFLQKAAAVFKTQPDRIFEQLNRSRSEPDRPLSETNLFEDLNLKYFGPADGHDSETLIEIFERLKEIKGPKILHTLTVKGKGYLPAETGNATHWHAPGVFDVKTGKVLKEEPGLTEPEKYQDVFGKTLVELARENSNIVAVTPAMPTGSSLNFMMEVFPDRVFDVGIAEQHAVTLSAGLAADGKLPFCAIYSTFLQRGYDQLIHDIAIQNLKVILCIDRAGLVGADGATHQGAYDLAYLRCIPGMIIMAPMNESELRNMLFTAEKSDEKCPVAVRYPRGRGVLSNVEHSFHPIEIGKGRELSAGSKTAILSLGTAGNNVSEALNILKDEGAVLPGHCDMRFLKPLDTGLLDRIAAEYESIITVEDGCIIGGFGSAVTEYFSHCGYKHRIIRLGIPDKIIEQGTQREQYAECGFDSRSIAETAKTLM